MDLRASTAHMIKNLQPENDASVTPSNDNRLLKVTENYFNFKGKQVNVENLESN